MLSKVKIKYIASLKQRKFRQKYNNFVAEGDKIAVEILKDAQLQIELICATEVWATNHQNLLRPYHKELIIVTPAELKKISSLSTPNQVLIVAEQPNYTIDYQNINQSLSLVLEHMQNPGNLGTIWRTADWFGIKHIFTYQSADAFNPKVLQASMGAFCRVPILPIEHIPTFFYSYNDLPKYGAVLGGDNAFEMTFPKGAFIVIGNEGKGISEETQAVLTHQVEIPKFGGAESLNAAMATGILCSLFRKN